MLMARQPSQNHAARSPTMDMPLAGAVDVIAGAYIAAGISAQCASLSERWGKAAFGMAQKRIGAIDRSAAIAQGKAVGGMGAIL